MSKTRPPPSWDFPAGEKDAWLAVLQILCPGGCDKCEDPGESSICWDFKGEVGFEEEDREKARHGQGWGESEE